MDKKTQTHNNRSQAAKERERNANGEFVSSKQSDSKSTNKKSSSK